MPPAIEQRPTKPYADQSPGTSGLRKKVVVFQQENYLANFVQATFSVIKNSGGVPETLLVGGDGRYFCKEAAQLIIKIAAANGVKRVWVGKDTLVSTPAVSVIIRRREGGFVAGGAFILTASHNSGGPTEDFGIKYNMQNGGPAPEKVTSEVFAATRSIQHYSICPSIPDIDLSAVGKTQFDGFSVEVIDGTEDYVTYMQELFDFPAIQRLLSRPDFSIQLDVLNGVGGPYVQRIFGEIFGIPSTHLVNMVPMPDFGGHHPDPNLTYAVELVRAMGLDAKGNPLDSVTDATSIPHFGAAMDGDADRNMVLGRAFFVNPSDSLAVLAANCDVVPFFRDAGGLKAVSRSMPTSGALDCVAAVKKLPLFEVPTGWKYFGNLMDSKDVFHGKDYNPLICGEESFGTGSSHIREKDGLWAILMWLSILAHHNRDPSQPFVGVQSLVENHWKVYGRNYYSRYDYERISTEAASMVMATVERTDPADIPPLRGVRCTSVDNFSYRDPVDGSTSTNQGVRVVYADGSRFVLRLSGTGSSGATIRLYLEQYISGDTVAAQLSAGTLPRADVALEDLIAVALRVSKMVELTGRTTPTVIT